MRETGTSLRSAAFVSLCGFGQLVVQFAFQVVLARYFGASAAMDAYVAALALPTVLSAVLVGSLGYAFVPVFKERLDSDSADDAWSLATTLGGLLFLMAGGLAALISLLAGPLASLLHPGFSAAQAEQTAGLLQILAWLILANSLITFLQSIYHCRGKFAVPALAPVIGTGVTLLLASVLARNIEAIAWAVLIGSSVAVVAQLPLFLRNVRLRIRIDEGIKRCLRLLMPLVLGAAYYRLDPLVDRYLASGLPTGSMSHLGYAWRLVNALLLVGTSGLSIVAFPTFVTHWTAGRRSEFQAEVASTMRCLCAILVPMVVGLLCYGEPLVRDLFQRGAFTPEDTEAVATLLVLYVGVLVAAAFGEVTGKIFYAVSDTRTPVIIGVCGFTLGVFLKFALTPVAGAAGIVIATSLYRLANASTMTGVVLRRLGREIYAGTGRTLLRSVASSVTAVLAVYPLVQSELPFGTILAAAVGGLVYLLGLSALRDEFALRLWAFVIRQFR